MKNVIIIVAILAASVLQAQDMKKLESMVGQWKGTAIMTDQNGRNEIHQTEDVKWGLDGKILIINGKGFKGEGGEKVFEAYGIIHWDPATSKYVFNAYTHEGRYTQAEAYFEGEDFIWTFEIPNNGGRIKYSLKLNDNSWVEDGQFSRDGETWYPFFHMELTRG